MRNKIYIIGYVLTCLALICASSIAKSTTPDALDFSGIRECEVYCALAGSTPKHFIIVSLTDDGSQSTLIVAVAKKNTVLAKLKNSAAVVLAKNSNRVFIGMNRQLSLLGVSESSVADVYELYPSGRIRLLGTFSEKTITRIVGLEAGDYSLNASLLTKSSDANAASTFFNKRINLNPLK